jgi:hypothetical protein
MHTAKARLFISLILLLSACHTNEKKSTTPEATVLTCVTALENFDIKTVRSLLAPNAQNDAMLASLESASTSMSEAQKEAYKNQFKDRNHQVTVTKEEDESASVTVTSEGGAPGMGFSFELTYEGNAWQIESIMPR